MGDARARRRRIQFGYEPVPKSVPPPRSPEQVEESVRRDDRNYAFIAAAIDFIHNTQEDVLRKHSEHLLRKT